MYLHLISAYADLIHSCRVHIKLFKYLLFISPLIYNLYIIEFDVELHKLVTNCGARHLLLIWTKKLMDASHMLLRKEEIYTHLYIFEQK